MGFLYTHPLHLKLLNSDSKRAKILGTDHSDLTYFSTAVSKRLLGVRYGYYL